MTARRVLQALAGLAVSAVALWLTFRGKDLGVVWAAIRDADYRVLFPYVGILLVIHLVRAARWAILLAPVARVPFARVNAASAVGFMALVVLPFRLGELARPLLVADRERLGVSSALSSVVVERIADGLFTAALLVAALLAVPESAPGVRVLRAGGIVIALVFASALGFLVLAATNHAVAVRVLERTLGPVSPRLARRAADVADRFIGALRAVPGRAGLAAFVLLTVAYWGLNGWGMKVLATGFGIDLSFHAAYTVLGVLVIGVMIPAGPGMVGTFQGAVVLGLALFLDPATVASRGTAYANVLWAVQMGQQIGLGVLFLFSSHIQLGRALGARDASRDGLEPG